MEKLKDNIRQKAFKELLHHNNIVSSLGLSLEKYNE